MGPAESPGPVIVCLDDEHDATLLVHYGIALARFLEVPLYLAFLIVLPAQRPLGVLPKQEERRANDLLDYAAGLVAANGVAVAEEIWMARSRTDAIQQMAEDLKASAVIVVWHGSGPLRLFDAGRTLLAAVSCPVLMVGCGKRDQVSYWRSSAGVT